MDGAGAVEGAERRIDETHDDSPEVQPSVEDSSPRRLRTQARRDMYAAIEDMDDIALEDALRNGASPNDSVPESMAYNHGFWGREKKWTALQHAVEKGRFATVKMLLNYGGDPNLMPEGSEQAALHLAVVSSRLDIVEVLLQHKADPNAPDENHRTPFEISLDRGVSGIANLLLAQPGIPINPTLGNSGKTVLHRACENGWGDTVEKLLDKGASVHARDRHGRLPIHYASESANVQVLSKLLAAGASPGVSDDRGKTPVFYAAEDGSAAAVQALVAAGASVRARDATGRTPLHEASANNRGKVVAQLISLGAEVNAAAHNGARPLHDAMLYGAFDAVDELLEARAEMSVLPGVADDTGHFPLLEPRWDRLLRLPSLGHHLGPGELRVSAPTDGSVRKEVCEGLQGALWPWNPAPFVLAVPTVQELLYSESPSLRKGLSLPGTSWIHLPANNVRCAAITYVHFGS